MVINSVGYHSYAGSCGCELAGELRSSTYSSSEVIVSQDRILQRRISAKGPNVTSFIGFNRFKINFEKANFKILTGLTQVLGIITWHYLLVICRLIWEW